MILSPSKAYSIGVALGDGSASAPNNRYRVVVRAKDKIMVENFARPFGVSVRLDKDDLWGATVGQKPIYDLLKDKKLTPELRAVFKKYPLSTLRGLYDADGGVSFTESGNRIYKEIFLVSSNQRLLNFVKDLLWNLFLIVSTKDEMPRSTRIMPDGHKAYFRKKIYRLRIRRWRSIEKFHQHIGFGIPRKQQTLEELIRTCNNKSPTRWRI